jgi:hypothetical protein
VHQKRQEERQLLRPPASVTWTGAPPLHPRQPTFLQHRW